MGETHRVMSETQSRRLLERAARLGFDRTGGTRRATHTSVSSSLAKLVAAMGKECLASKPTATDRTEGGRSTGTSLGHSSLSFGSSAEHALLQLINQHEEELRGLSGWDRVWEESQRARVDAVTSALERLRPDDVPASRHAPRKRRRPEAAADVERDGVEDAPLRARASTGPSVLPDAAVRTLMQWFVDHLEHPYPSAAEKQALQAETGLTREQTRNYMTNLRKRHWHPLCRGRPPRNALEEHLLQSAKKQGIL